MKGIQVSQEPQNIVPIVFMSNVRRDLEGSMKEVTNLFQSSYLEFERAYGALLGRVGDDKGLKDDLNFYVENCHTLVTGLMEWSRQTRRYGLAQYVSQEGSLTITL